MKEERGISVTVDNGSDVAKEELAIRTGVVTSGVGQWVNHKKRRRDGVCYT